MKSNRDQAEKEEGDEEELAMLLLITRLSAIAKSYGSCQLQKVSEP